MRGMHGAGAASTHVAGQHLVSTARGFASWMPVIERRAVFLDLAHHTSELGYKNGSAALLQRTNTMPLYYLFGLDKIKLSSFGKAVFLVGLWWFLAALLGTLIGWSIILLMIVMEERARDNAHPGMGVRDAEEDGAMGVPPPRLILRQSVLAE
mgnify:CR=1 FL=1